MNHERIINLLGGYKEVAEWLELHPTTVFKWTRDGIPHKRWLEIETLARRRNKPQINLESIARSYGKKDTED